MKSKHLIWNIRANIEIKFHDYYLENIDINIRFEQKNIISYINSLYFILSIGVYRRIKDHYL